MAGADAALEIGSRVEQDRHALEARRPAPAGELVGLTAGLGAEVTGRLELAVTQDVDAEHPARREDGIGGMGGVDAEREQERLEADLGDPRGGKGVAPVAMGDADDVQAVGEAAEQVEWGVGHRRASGYGGLRSAA